MKAQHPPRESLDQLSDSVIRRVRRAIEQVTDGTASAGDMMDVLAMLSTLPMTTFEFGVATCRLKNACQYLNSDQRGAARYELRMLLGSLSSSAASDARTARAGELSKARRRRPASLSMPEHSDPDALRVQRARASPDAVND